MTTSSLQRGQTTVLPAFPTGTLSCLAQTGQEKRCMGRLRWAPEVGTRAQQWPGGPALAARGGQGLATRSRAETGCGSSSTASDGVVAPGGSSNKVVMREVR